MRAIIRFSVDSEANSALRNKLVGGLQTAGFHRYGNTATYEHPNIDQGDLGTAVSDFWATAAGHQGPGRIDHFWMYCDRTDVDAILQNSN